MSLVEPTTRCTTSNWDVFITTADRWPTSPNKVILKSQVVKSNLPCTLTTQSPRSDQTKLAGPMVTICPYAASVFTDIVNFTKEMTIDQGGHPIWTLTKNMTSPIHITDPLLVKRFEPKPTEDDISAINQALSSAISAIDPKNVKQQISDLIN